MTDHRIRNAFRELRQRGFLARDNYLCCRECAGTQLCEDATEMGYRGQKIRGAVFFSADDQEKRKELGYFAVSYGPLDTWNGIVGEPALAVGYEACDVLRKHGLTVDWDGDEKTALVVVERMQ